MFVEMRNRWAGASLAALAAVGLAWFAAGPAIAGGAGSENTESADIAESMESTWLTEEDMVNEFDGDPEAIEYGRDRYSSRCSYCHGGGGLGAKGPNLVDDHWKFGGKMSEVFFNIAAGIPRTQMGAFGGSLDGDEIWKILAYLKAENAMHTMAASSN